MQSCFHCFLCEETVHNDAGTMVVVRMMWLAVHCGVGLFTTKVVRDKENAFSDSRDFSIVVHENSPCMQRW